MRDRFGEDGRDADEDNGRMCEEDEPVKGM